jgi:hypothetical protein
VPGLKINRKQLTPITEEGLSDTGEILSHRRLMLCKLSSYESDFDVCTAAFGGRAEILTLPLYDLFYL